MGYSRYTYVGPYVKIWLPDVEETNSMRTCTDKSCEMHGRGRHSFQVKFCPICGSSIAECLIKKTTSMCMYSFMEEHFYEGDLFQEITTEFLGFSKNQRGFSLLIPNCKDQGGISTYNGGDGGEFPLPDLSMDQFKAGDWIRLINELDKEKIRYETKIGYIAYDQ